MPSKNYASPHLPGWRHKNKRSKRDINKNFKEKVFQEGDCVLRCMFQNTQELNAEKLSTKWEGPYKIFKVVGKGAYKLQTLDDEDIPRSWNATHLKMYYF